MNRLKFKTSGGLLITLEESMEYTSNQYRKPEGCQHVTGWTCKHKDLNPIMPKNLRDHCPGSKPDHEHSQLCFTIHTATAVERDFMPYVVPVTNIQNFSVDC